MKKSDPVEKDFKDYKYYLNRELSLLEFQSRVLAEAENKEHPLLERLKFVAILSSNLDEFFMIRVAGLKRQISAGVSELSFDGMTPKQQLIEIRKKLDIILRKQETILLNEILPALEKENIFLHRSERLSEDDREYLKKYFFECVFKALTPLSLDPAHPFPRIVNRSLNIAFVLSEPKKKIQERRISILQLPTYLPRIVRLENREGYHFILLEQIIKMFADALFPGLNIITSNVFRVTRDADIEIAEDEAEDLLLQISEQVKQREWGTSAVRLEVSANMPEYLLERLRKQLEVEPIDIYVFRRPLKLPDFMELTRLDIRHLKDKPFSTRVIPEIAVKKASIFEVMKKRDILLHHPFDSFTNSVLKFIEESAVDKDVVAIKITLYRTGTRSAIVDALKRAAENGKDVTAFVELKARFDEENNIVWARELENVGVHVVYGVLGLKTHCKIAMVVRNEGKKLKTYLHLATGNYNQVTARLYTDIGLLTARDDFSLDAVHLFNYLTGYSNYSDWDKFIVAPINMRQTLVKLIEREMDLHTPENPGLIMAKMNSLAHDEVIPALYRASQKGVKIKLIVRGICCLKPGLPKVSENIEVRSILGRFLEHSRITYFKNGGNEEVYLSSADWMTRNLQRRVELMFPVLDEGLKRTLKEILDYYWMDNQGAWVLNSDGSYEKIKPKKGEPKFCAQRFFIEQIKASK